MANRLVFRGKINLHVLYCGEGGSIKAFDGEIPFSQYTDLDHEFTESAAAMVLPALTTLEMEWEEGVGLSCKCSIAAQYIVYDRRNLSVIEDAYCPGRQVSLQREHLSVPVRLDVLKQDLRMEQRAEGKGKILSAQLIVDSPEVMQVSDTAEIRVPGIFRLLTQDPDGNYAVQTVSAEEKWEIMSDTDNRLRVCTSVSESPSTAAAGDDTLASDVVQMEVHVLSQQAFSVVSEIQLGDMQPLDPKRPSLILCRADGADLWQIAKRYGSTVEALRSANGITDQPEPDRLLLIPIA